MHARTRAGEGDFLEDSNGIIFDVKGLVHPPNRVIAFPRFYPDAEGERKRGETRYSKVYALNERFALLRHRFPHYLVFDKVFDELLCEVPVNEIKRYYKPVDRLGRLRRHGEKGLDAVELDALRFAELVKAMKIRWSKIGISGSLLVDLHMPTSDIDLVVYGLESCKRVHSGLQRLLKTPDSPVQHYNLQELRKLFDFRSKDTQVDFEDFLRTERRKTLQGRFMNRDYFVRFVRDWDEVDERYGSVQYTNVGYAKIKATVVNADEAIFTPCIYKVGNVQVLEGLHAIPVRALREIASFRGRFCEQALTGETVVARGKVEKVTPLKAAEPEYYRVLLGNKPTDFMTLV